MLQIGENEWEIIVGRGHSPEHACLYCRDTNILISGDQLLPKNFLLMSASIQQNRAQIRWADWLDSLATLKDRTDPGVLVLPAHGKPFRGAHARLDALIEEHADCLNKLEALCAEPKRAVDVFPALFRTKITKHNLIMATGESVAHLNYLLNKGRMTVARDDDDVDWYRSHS